MRCLLRKIEGTKRRQVGADRRKSTVTSRSVQSWPLTTKQRVLGKSFVGEHKKRRGDLHTLTCSVSDARMRVCEHGRDEAGREEWIFRMMNWQMRDEKRTQQFFQVRFA